MAYDSARGETVLFGGLTSSGIALRDTWEWNGKLWVQVSDIGPQARAGHTMAYDALRGVTVLFGGYSPSGPYQDEYLGDTWEWDGATWSLKSTEGPGPRAFHAMAYDEMQNMVIIYGGTNALGDTWAWNGSEWKRRAAGGNPVFNHAMTYDSSREALVTYGDGWRSDAVYELQPGFPIHDVDRDCDVDLFEIAELQVCFGEWPLFLDCARFDFNRDHAVDGADLTLLLTELSGPYED